GCFVGSRARTDQSPPGPHDPPTAEPVMHPEQEQAWKSRRQFLTSTASGLGAAALASLLRDDGLLAQGPAPDAADPMTVRPPHFAPRARACICIYLEGAPSQIDLFD